MKTVLLTVAASLAVLTFNVAPRASAKDKAKRHTVLDAFYLLPYVGNALQSKAQRRELLNRKNKPILDLKNDYIEVNPDSYPPQQVAIFRYRGAELVATSTPDSVSDYNNFHLYRFGNGQLRDVTKKELPAPARTDNYLYQLPRTGTTIRVYQFDLSKQSRQHTFDLQWRGGKFVKAPAR